MENESFAKTYAVFDDPENAGQIERALGSGGRFILLPVMLRQVISTDDIFSRLEQFSWVMVSDAWAADAFVKAVEDAGQQVSDMDDVRFCSIGESTAARLRQSFVHSDITTATDDQQAGFARIAEYTTGEPGQRVVIMHGKSAPTAPGCDRYPQFEVVGAQVYRAIFPDDGEAVRLRSLLIGGAADAVIVSSVDEALSLKTMLGKSLNALAAETEILAFGSEAFQALHEIGIRANHLRT